MLTVLTNCTARTRVRTGNGTLSMLHSNTYAAATGSRPLHRSLTCSTAYNINSTAIVYSSIEQLQCGFYSIVLLSIQRTIPRTAAVNTSTHVTPSVVVFVEYACSGLLCPPFVLGVRSAFAPPSPRLRPACARSS